MKKKTIIAMLILCIMAFNVCFAAEPLTNNEMPNETIIVLLKGTQVEFDVPPITVNSRVMVPMRKIFEALDADVDWNDDTQTVTAIKDDLVVELEINNAVMLINGNEIILDVPPLLTNGRTLVPVRAVAESFNAKVDWDELTQSVLIIVEETATSTVPEPTPVIPETIVISPEIPTSENLQGEYKVETVVDKLDIKKIQSLVYVNDILYFLDNDVLKKYDLTSKDLSTISDFKSLDFYDETNKRTYSDYSPICLAYNRFTDKVMIFGQFKKTDDNTFSRFAVCIVGSEIEIVDTYDKNPIRNYTDEPRFCFIDAYNVYCWNYDNENGNMETIWLGQDRARIFKINVFLKSNEAYAHYCLIVESYQKANIGVKFHKIGGNNSSNIAIRPIEHESIVECSYEEDIYVLAEDGTINKYIGGTVERKVHIDKDDIPEDYELSKYNIKFWQFDKDALPVWYDDYTKTIKRIVKLAHAN